MFFWETLLEGSVGCLCIDRIPRQGKSKQGQTELRTRQEAQAKGGRGEQRRGRQLIFCTFYLLPYNASDDHVTRLIALVEKKNELSIASCYHGFHIHESYHNRITVSQIDHGRPANEPNCITQERQCLAPLQIGIKPPHTANKFSPTSSFLTASRASP